jgi:hypothetical protein
MGVLAWLPLGMAAALPANMLLPGKRQSGRPGGITRRRDVQEGSL